MLLVPSLLLQGRKNADRPAQAEHDPIDYRLANRADFGPMTSAEGYRGTVRVESRNRPRASHSQAPRARAIVQRQVAIAIAHGRQAGDDDAILTDKCESGCPHFL